MDWRQRELARFNSGQYRLVPWARERWWVSLIAPPEGVLRDHYAHASVVDGMVAFTMTEEHGIADRQTRMKPGRYLERYCKPHLEPAAIRDWVSAFSVECAENTLHFATTPDEIERIYTSGPQSCMSAPASAYQTGGVHPSRVYGAGDLAVAYLTRKTGKVNARCLVWPDKRIRTRLYGDEGRLVRLLDDAGFKEGALYGARLLKIPLRPGFTFVCPYIDWHDYVHDEGEYLVIRSGSGARSKKRAFVAQMQSGFCQALNALQCEICSTPYAPEDLPRDRYGRVCEPCRSNFVVCPNCQEGVPEHDFVEAIPGWRTCYPCYERTVRRCYICRAYVRLPSGSSNVPHVNFRCELHATTRL